MLRLCSPLASKVPLDNTLCLRRHVFIRVRLQLLEPRQPLGLVHGDSVWVGPTLPCRLALARLEDILNTLDRNRHQRGVLAREQVTQRLDAALLHEGLYLLGGTAACRVGDGPGRLLLDVELGGGEEVHERRDDLRIDDGLDLLACPGSDVGDGPARLLADALLGRVKQREQPGQQPAIEGALRLGIVARHHVAHSAERRRLHLG